MTASEQDEFNADSASFDWDQFIIDYMAGLAIYAFKEDKVEPLHQFE